MCFSCLNAGYGVYDFIFFFKILQKMGILNHRHCHPLIIIRFCYCRKILQKVCGCSQKKRVEKRIINQIRTETAEYETRLPKEFEVRERIEGILQSDMVDIDKAICLCLYTMKTQVFIDGNKRAAVIFANHFLIAHGQGFLVIPEVHVADFKKLLAVYYEGENERIITAFLKDNCWKIF